MTIYPIYYRYSKGYSREVLAKEIYSNLRKILIHFLGLQLILHCCYLIKKTTWIFMPYWLFINQALMHLFLKVSNRQSLWFQLSYLLQTIKIVFLMECFRFQIVFWKDCCCYSIQTSFGYIIFQLRSRDLNRNHILLIHFIFILWPTPCYSQAFCFLLHFRIISNRLTLTGLRLNISSIVEFFIPLSWCVKRIVSFLRFTTINWSCPGIR